MVPQGGAVPFGGLGSLVRSPMVSDVLPQGVGQCQVCCCVWCVCAVFLLFSTLFAVGFRVSMIGGASVMRGIVRMGASSITLCSASRSRARRSASTLCLSATGGGLRIFLTCRARSRSNRRPFVVSLACAVCSVRSSVNAQKCWCGVNEGNWQ